MNSDDVWNSDAVRTLRERLLKICLEYDEDDETTVCAIALFQALMVVITCGAPTPEEAKSVLKGTLARAEPGIDAAWAQYRARDTN